MQQYIDQYALQYKSALLDNVIPFWMEHSIDPQGGYFTCLLQDGKVYDTDKFIWLQARQVWTFAMLYNQQEAREEWLDIALHGGRYLLKHGKDRAGDWYFSLNQAGQPLVKAYNIFSDCFACMAFAQLYYATKKEQYREEALATFANILKRKSNPKGKYTKTVGETRPLKNFALPMILCNLSLELEPLLPAAQVQATIDECIQEVMYNFYDPKSGLVLENILPDGSLSDSFEGRLLNPGHAIEAMWFIMDLGQQRNDQELIDKAVERSLEMLQYGWDKEHGGIFYFMDRKGYPPQQLEWDQKLWWVHLETLVALLKGYALTKNTHCWKWFEKVHEYTWTHFRDKEYGEWFGYLNREGKVLLPLKGGKWKGCFHVPRGLWQSWRILEQLQT